MELRPSHFKIYYINAFDKNNNHLLNKWRKHTKKKKQDRSCSPLLSFMMRPSEEWAEKPHCAPHLSLCRVSHWEQNRDGLSPSQSRLSQLRPFSLWHSWDWGADYYLHRHTDSTVCRAAPARRKGPHFILLYVFAAAAGTSYSRLNDDDKKYTNKKKTTYSTYSWLLRVFFVFIL